MVLIITTVIGILLLSTGNGSLGLLFLLPSIIAIIINIIKKSYENSRTQEKIDKCRATARAEQAAKEHQRQEALSTQNRLVGQFKTSALTKEILRKIQDDLSQQVPQKIKIYDSRIQGEYGGRVSVYDFAKHRVVSPFRPIIKTVKGDELQYIVRPQLAMAEAINALLGNKYVIRDCANIDVHQRTDCDGDVYFLDTYTSDHVEMVLKSTLPNRQFE